MQKIDLAPSYDRDGEKVVYSCRILKCVYSGIFEFGRLTQDRVSYGHSFAYE